jgi:hypothetical protein
VLGHLTKSCSGPLAIGCHLSCGSDLGVRTLGVRFPLNVPLITDLRIFSAIDAVCVPGT